MRVWNCERGEVGRQAKSFASDLPTPFHEPDLTERLAFFRHTRSFAEAGIRSVCFGARLPYRFGVSRLITITPGSVANQRCTVSGESFHCVATSLTVNTSSFIHVSGRNEQMEFSGSYTCSPFNEIFFSALQTGRGAAFRVAAWPSNGYAGVAFLCGAGGPGRSRCQPSAQTSSFGYRFGSRAASG